MSRLIRVITTTATLGLTEVVQFSVQGGGTGGMGISPARTTELAVNRTKQAISFFME